MDGVLSYNNAMRRRTGVSMVMTTGYKSFKTNDNNPRIEALARVRGGGSCVPPKVSKRNTVPYRNTSASVFYRIISAGYTACSESPIVTWSGSTAYGQSPGFYTYTPTQQTAISTVSLDNFKRSYNVMTIDRTYGNITTAKFDVFGDPGPSQSPQLVSYLNGLTNSVIVVIATYDEPKTATGLPIPTDMIDAIKRCGGSSDFGSSPAGILKFRSAYILIGIPGIGTGNGIQRYNGAMDADPTAALDVRISVFGGQYTYISG